MSKNKKIVFMYVWSVILIALGLIFNYFKLGLRAFAGFSSLGSWLIYIGFIGLILSSIKSVWKSKRKVDERMIYISSKANRVIFLSIVLISFIVMIVDGIKPITIPYYLFMSYFVMGLLIIYYVSYKILLKYN
ncbi:MAG: hypothetical protein KKC75_00775 [Nanoarchaeota archaeon]|nr:hypothetical protein [Nanoarchaeota archaeon]MBU1005443.1 hypothetical protein [Nanoarchaeota archaeon]MBU1946360.1 hypothetical protein [Nanoarchaeota archaeon]